MRSATATPVIALVAALGACSVPSPEPSGLQRRSAPLGSVSPEVELAAPTSVPGPGGSSNPRVASDGTRFLVAFDDSRLGSNQAFAVRVRADGTLEDPAAFPLGPLPGTAKALGVAYGGGVFLVAWLQGTTLPSTLRAVRVTPAGVVLDQPPLTLAFQSSIRPRIAFGGGVFGVVYAVGGDVRFLTVPVTGNPSSATTICNDGTGTVPHIASDGASFLVAWRDTAPLANGVRGTGVSVGGQPDVLCGDEWVPGGDWPSLAFAGGEYLLAWENAPTVYVAKRQANGTFGGGAQVGPGENPELAAFGSQLIVAYQDSSGAPPALLARRVTANGNTSGGVITTALDGYSVAVGSDGVTALVVGGGSGEEISGQRISAAGAVLDPVPLMASAGPSAQTDVHPMSAGAGQPTLVAWTDSATDGADVLGTRVDDTGMPLDAPPLTLAAGTRSQELTGAAPGPPGTSLLAWTDHRTGNAELRVSRVDAQGAPLDGQGVVVAGPPLYRSGGAVASDGADFLTAFIGYNAGSRLYGARVAGSGALLGAPVELAPLVSTTSPPVAAWTAGMSLVGYSTSPSGLPDAFAVRVDASGNPLDSPPLNLATGSGDQQLSDLVADANGFIALLSDDASGTAQVRIRRVSTNGALGPFRDVTSGSKDATDPSGLLLGGRLLVVWKQATSTGGIDLWSAELDPANLTLLVPPAPLSTEAGDELHPRLATLGSGEGLLVYPRVRTTAPAGIRAFARVLSMVDGGVVAPDGGMGDPDGGMGEQDGGSPAADAGTGGPDGGMGGPDAGADGGLEGGGDGGEVSEDGGPVPWDLAVGCGCQAGQGVPGGALWLFVAAGVLGVWSRRLRRT